MRKLSFLLLNASISTAVALLVCFSFIKNNTEDKQTKEFQLPVKTVADRVKVMNEPMTSFAAAAKKATPVVVHIRAEESEAMASRRRRDRMFSFEDFFGGGFSPFYKREGSGSGVIFSSDGYIVTNNHVVEFADIIDVTLNDERVFRAVKVGADAAQDIAVLKIEADDLPTIDWAPSEEAKVGDWVLAIGNPFDYLTSTVTAGIISAKGRDLEIDIERGSRNFTNFIQTDAAVNPGNSGGALVDAKGNLLGINTAIATPTGVYAGYSFAIPIETVREIVDAILSGSTKPNIGFEITSVDEDLADHLNLKTNEGVLVLKLVQGGAAQFAGLRPFDVIVEVEDQKVRSIEELEAVIATKKLGEVVEMQVLREDEIIKIPLTLKQ